MTGLDRDETWQMIRQARDLAMYIQLAVVIVALAWWPALNELRRRWPQLVSAIIVGGVLTWICSLILLLWLN